MRFIIAILSIVVINSNSSGQSIANKHLAIGSQFGLASFGVSSKLWIIPLVGVQISYGKLSASAKDEHSVRKEYDSEDIFTASNIGGRLLIRVHRDKNMSAYVGVGMARYTLSFENKEAMPEYEDEKTEITGTGLELLAGAEWSFDEIPHLAFFSEMGISRISFTDKDEDRYYSIYDPDTGEYTEGTETVKYTYTLDGIPSLFAKAGVFFYF